MRKRKTTKKRRRREKSSTAQQGVVECVMNENSIKKCSFPDVAFECFLRYSWASSPIRSSLVCCVDVVSCRTAFSYQSGEILARRKNMKRERKVSSQLSQCRLDASHYLRSISFSFYYSDVMLTRLWAVERVESSSLADFFSFLKISSSFLFSCLGGSWHEEAWWSGN